MMDSVDVNKNGCVDRIISLDHAHLDADYLDAAIWHAKRGDAAEALYALSKCHPDFLPFFDLSEKMRAMR